MSEPEPEVNPSADPGPFRRARWKVTLAVTVFSVVLGLVAAEAIAHQLPPRDATLFVPHPLCWRVALPGALVSAAPADKAASFTTNRFGLRGASVKTRAKPKDVYRIVFVGDAQLFAARRAEEETYAGRVERELTRLRGQDDLKVEVANAGLPGAPLPVLHAHLVHRLLPLEPDLVVVASAAEDVRLSERLPAGEEALDPFRAALPEPPSLGEWLASVSDLARFVRARTSAAPVESVAPGAGTPASPDVKRGLALYRQTLHRIAVVCRDAHVDLAVMTEPALWKSPLSPEERRTLEFPTAKADAGPGSPDELRGALDAFDEEVRSAAAREGATLVDLARAELVPRNLSHFENDIELTPAGHAVVARAIVSVVFGDKPAARRP